jgi:hypothetical protein
LGLHLLTQTHAQFGLVGRLYNERVIAQCKPCYYLKTYPEGAVVKESPSQGYSIYKDDEAAEGGFALLETKAAQPSDNDSMDVMDGIDVEEKDVPFLAGLADFVNGMMRM